MMLVEGLLRGSVLTLLCIVFSAAGHAQSAAELRVSDFAGSGIADWEKESFAGETSYALVEVQGDLVLQAHSQSAASGLVRRLTVDLRRTPILRWSWRVEHPLAGLAERTKAGDDYAARLYVIRSGGSLFWRTRAVNYVWSGSQAAGSRWFNAYTDKACMIAVRGVDDLPGRWYAEQRDVAADFRDCFGVETVQIDAVALMSDTDNAKGQAEALYGEILFTAE